MKLYLVRPNLPADADNEEIEARLRACVQPIADLIASHIEADSCLYGLWHEDTIGAPPIEQVSCFGKIRGTRLNSPELRIILANVGDPSGEYGMLIRSLVTCRSVRYGFDGEAFVCLMAEDEPMISPDIDLITVEECSSLLVESDWMDGISELQELQ